MTIPINTSIVLGTINLYQVSNMIRDNNKIFDCKLNEIRKEYDCKFYYSYVLIIFNI